MRIELYCRELGGARSVAKGIYLLLLYDYLAWLALFLLSSKAWRDDKIANFMIVPTAKSLKLEPSSSSGRVFYAAKSTKTKEKRPGVHSLSSSIPSRRQVSNLSAPLIPSRNHISAVLVPPPQPSPAECRRIFLENLRVLRGVTLVNIVDDTSPPLEFKFAQESTLGNNVTRTTKEFMSGCNCRIENGRSIGCEYLSCECLDDVCTVSELLLLLLLPYPLRAVRYVERAKTRLVRAKLT